MLMITQSTNRKTDTLRFEGKLLGPWLNEAKDQIERALVAARVVSLDLSRVSFVDESGAVFLRGLLPRGIRMFCFRRNWRTAGFGLHL